MHRTHIRANGKENIHLNKLYSLPLIAVSVRLQITIKVRHVAKLIQDSTTHQSYETDVKT